MLSNIRVTHSPHIGTTMSTRSVMLDVIIGLVPAVIAAGIYFRLHAILLIAVSIGSCCLTEYLCNLIRKQPNSLKDLSAVVTGIILALSLPPGLPSWAAVIGGFVSIAIGKMVFGGLGANIFNPAMVGRAFLTVSFASMMTTWTVPATIDPNMPDTSLDNTLEFRTQASPMALSKTAIKNKADAATYHRQQLKAMFIGETAGSLGETSTLALLLGGIYLLIRKTITIHTPLAVLLSAFVFADIAYLINSDAYVNPLYHLTGGALVLGAFFIATDPVTAPLTRRGMWLFGAGVGIITMTIRILGAYPEGLMFAVLLMNSVSPLIDRLFKKIPAGGKPHA